jgi:hypothetical protein
MTNHRIARSSRRVVLLATAALAAVSLAAQARAASSPTAKTLSLAETWNEWDIPTLDPATNTFGPTGIRFIYQGDAVSDHCIPAQLTADPRVNAFFAEQIWQYGGGVAHHTSVVYDSSVNETFVTLSGTMPLNVPAPPSGTFPGPTDGNGNNTNSYHNGLVAGYQSGCSTNPLLKKQWEWQKGKSIQYADVQVAQAYCDCVINNENYQTAKEAILYVEVADPVTGLPNNGTWNAIPYATGGTQANFVLQNNGSNPITFSNVLILMGVAPPNDKSCLTHANCKGNQAFLDTLNNTYYPVSGGNSPFQNLNLEGATLQPGGVINIGVGLQ